MSNEKHNDISNILHDDIKNRRTATREDRELASFVEKNPRAYAALREFVDGARGEVDAQRSGRRAPEAHPVRPSRSRGAGVRCWGA